MLKLFVLSFCIIVLSSLNVKALSNIEGSKQGITSADGQPLHHPQGQSTSVGIGSSRRILRSPEPHSFYHGGQGGGSLEGLHHGGQFGVRGQGGRRIVRELGGQNQQSGLTKEEKVVGSQRLTREEHKKQQIEGQHSLNGRVSREPLSNDSPDLEHNQPGLVGGQNRQLIHGNLRSIRETMNFVPKNAIESHRSSRDQHGFVGKQFTSGIGGIEGPNLEPKGTRITRHQQLGLNQPNSRIGTRITRHQQMVENQPKGVRISGQNVD